MQGNLDPHIREKGEMFAELLFSADLRATQGDYTAAAEVAKSARNVAREIGVPSLNRDADRRVLQFSMRSWAEAITRAQAAGGRMSVSRDQMDAWIGDAWHSGLALLANPTVEELPNSPTLDLRRIAILVVANDPKGSKQEADHLRGISESQWKAIVTDASQRQIPADRLVEWLLPRLRQQADPADAEQRTREQVNGLVQEADRLFGNLQYAKAIETLIEARQLLEPYQQQLPTVVPGIDRLILRRCYEAHTEAMLGKVKINRTWLEIAWDAAVRVLNTSPEHVPNLDRLKFVEGLHEIALGLAISVDAVPLTPDPRWFELCERAASERVPGTKLGEWLATATDHKGFPS
jgi:hypothetical protein